MNRFQARGIREHARFTARRLIDQGVTDRERLGELVRAECLRWVKLTGDPAEDRPRLASIGYGLAEALGIDVGEDPGESLAPPDWSIEAESADESRQL